MTPLVLLPGMMCDARLFGPQIAALGQRRALHLAALTEHATTADLARAVLAAAPPRFALAGLSMGGIIAIEIVHQAPERVERLALLDTNPRAELPEVQARRAPQMEKARTGHLRAVMRDEMKPNYLVESPDKQRILDLCMEMAMGLGPEVFVRQSLALRDRPDRQETLRGVTVPTLVLCGQEDQLCPVERHRLMHDLVPGSRLEILPGAAHLPTLEQPLATNAALARWLEE
ncbi:MAG: alpha/beta fold hydrolase [Rhodobacteraceae bacterium]|nr:alpha/beta fold hydrolase [Paracoccaceae bacterium]